MTWTTWLILSALSLAACTAGENHDQMQPTELMTPSPTSTFDDFAGFKNEYRRAADLLLGSLPPGAEFPAEPPGEWEREGNFEQGTGEVAAVLHWRCAWATAYVESAGSGDVTGAEEALDRLAEWGELRGMRDHSDEDTRAKWLERVVEPARTGADATLRGIQAECA